jgi:hypothetical protein
MASVVISGDTSGAITIDAPAVAGTNTQTLVAATGTLAPLIAGTAQTASGSSVDFTSIPSWVKRITLMLEGVSTNGTNNPVIRIGDSGGLEITGYFSQAGNISGTNATQLTTATASWAIPSGNAANTLSGVYTIVNITGNTWLISGTGTGNTGNISYIAGSKTLSDTLDRISFITADTFDAGTINILYE